jgi:hypothetical protein
VPLVFPSPARAFPRSTLGPLFVPRSPLDDPPLYSGPEPDPFAPLLPEPLLAPERSRGMAMPVPPVEPPRRPSSPREKPPPKPPEVWPPLLPAGAPEPLLPPLGADFVSPPPAAGAGADLVSCADAGTASSHAGTSRARPTLVNDGSVRFMAENLSM